MSITVTKDLRVRDSPAVASRRHPPPLKLRFHLVMRACEGCRRRKIKCDAATTNSWPCSSCVRLKLQCVPPSLNYDTDLSQPSATYDSKTPEDQRPTDDEVRDHPDLPHRQMLGGDVPTQTDVEIDCFDGNPGPYNEPSYISREDRRDGTYAMSYTSGLDASGDLHCLSYPLLARFSDPPPARATAAMATPESWQSDPYGTEQLSDALGELRVDENGVGTLFGSILVSVLCFSTN